VGALAIEHDDLSLLTAMPDWRQPYAVISLPLICKSKPFGSVTWKLLSVSGLGFRPRRFNSAATALLFHPVIVYAMWSMRDGVTSDGAFRGIMKVLLSLSTRQHCFPVSMFSKAILENKEVPVSIEDGMRNMAVIEAVFRSAESGQWEIPRDSSGQPTSFELPNSPTYA
jgi:hypothetical protein